MQALNRSVVLWMQPQNEWGSCDGVDEHRSCFGVTSRACVPLFSKQSTTVQQKKDCYELQHCLLSIGKLKHLPQVYNCDQEAGKKAGMPWKAGRGEVKIFKPSVLFLFLYMIQQRTEGIAFCCSGLVFYAMAVTSVQPFRAGVSCAWLSAFARQSSFTEAGCRWRW